MQHGGPPPIAEKGTRLSARTKPAHDSTAESYIILDNWGLHLAFPSYKFAFSPEALYEL